MTGPDPDGLRVGDREREQAVTVLHDAVGGGYLDLAEFEERSRTVYAARTRGDLRTALADLPAGVRLFPPPPPTGVVATGTEPTAGAETMDIDWTTRRRRGPWQVPSRLVVSGSMGTADIDLQEATFPPAGAVIDVATSWSTVKIRLAATTAVRTDDFQGGFWTSLKDKAGPPSLPGGPVLEIRGHPDVTTVVLRRA